ncbi:lysoplasmalogenase-like protein TMEM86A isoform X1 [Carcharodon carcharias]|uniref:lysoplasmalogenase-like protein TMEM86A isoform X1 n=2 Tax=Carcharodon carcharias TaxID=13397 RepID=UPI001B7E508D|nr:lysoplasmalogenase-like protein TMEM86A isoform X1 [Carcharodon carcharias]
MDLKWSTVWFQELCRFIPYLLSVCIYFVLAPQSSCPLWMKALLKCIPILFLCTYILTRGINMCTHSKAQKLIAGLLFSAAGDIFRTTSTQLYHFYGDSMFGLTHVFYIWMFGAEPLNLLAGFYLMAIGTIYLLFLNRCLWDQKPIQWTTYIYISLIGTMAWRASAGALFNQHWSWIKLSGTIGGMLFMVSDFTYAVSMYCFPASNFGLIAATYYAAQMLISLSAVNTKSQVIKK